MFLPLNQQEKKQPSQPKQYPLNCLRLHFIPIQLQTFLLEFIEIAINKGTLYFQIELL